MMKRAHVAEYYTAYLDGSLPEPLRGQVEVHLHVCPQCAAELEDMRAMLADLRDLPLLMPPADFAAGVRARLPQSTPRRAPRWLLPTLAGGMAAASLALVLVFARVGMTPTLRQMANAPVAPSMNRNITTAEKGPLGGNAPQVAAAPPSLFDKKPITESKPDEFQPRPQRKVRVKNTGVRADTVTAGKPGHVVSPSPAPDRVEVALVPPMEMGFMAKSAMPNMAMDQLNTNDTTVYMSTDGSHGPQGPAGPQGATGASQPPLTVMAAPEGSAEVTPPGMAGGKALQVNGIAPRVMMAEGAVRNAVQSVQGTGTVEVRLQPAKGDAPAQLILCMPEAKQAGSLNMNYARPISPTNQSAVIPAQGHELAVALPNLPDGAAITLSFAPQQLTVGTDTRAAGLQAQPGELYLFVPGPATPRPAATDTLSTLQWVANQTRQYLLCPATLLRNATPAPLPDETAIALLNRLATQANYQVDAAGSLLNIAPQPEKR